MAIDHTWVAVPVESRLFKEAKSGRHAEDIEFLASAYGKTLRDIRDRPAFARAVDEILEERPDIVGRTFNSAGRCYAMIAYLISPEIRRQREWDSSRMKNPASKIIFGDRPVHPAALTTIGRTILYNDPSLVRNAAGILASYDEAGLFDHFQPQDMEAAAVYKFFADRAEGYKPHILSEFEGLRDLYKRTSDVGDEALLIIES